MAMPGPSQDPNRSAATEDVFDDSASPALDKPVFTPQPSLQGFLSLCRTTSTNDPCIYIQVKLCKHQTALHQE